MWFDLHSLMILEKIFTQQSSLKSGLLTSLMISHKKSSPHLSRPSALGKRGWSGAFNRNPPKVLQLAHSSALPLQKNASTTLQKKQCIRPKQSSFEVPFLRDSVRFLEPIKCYKLNDLPKSKVTARCLVSPVFATEIFGVASSTSQLPLKAQKNANLDIHVILCDWYYDRRFWVSCFYVTSRMSYVIFFVV